jgi:transposase
MLLPRETDFELRARLPSEVAAVPLPAASRCSPMVGAAVMHSTIPTVLDLDMHRLDDVLRRAEEALPEEDYAILKAVVESYSYIADLVGDKNTSIARLRKLLFGAKTEKTAAVLGKQKTPPSAPSAVAATPAAANSPDASAPTSAAATVESAAGDAAKNDDDASKGHGRNGAEAYTGAEQIRVPHESLRAGDPCPKCEEGTVYEWKYPGVLVRLKGQPPIGAMIYYLQKLRCGLCCALFTAAQPEGVGNTKRDATVGSMIALLKYGAGTPFHREEKLQASLGIPLPASTQWDIVRDQAERAKPAWEELLDQAADGDVLFNDDTTVRILEAMGARGAQAATAEDTVDSAADTAGDTPADAAESSSQQSKPERTGMFTSGIVATRDGRRIALFFSGHQHAGENLKDVLSRRAAERGAPIQMCDALARNLPGELQTIVANCLAHGRRRFIDEVDRFPEECRHVLESLAVVYKNDALAREQKLSPQARLEFHQAESGPVMEELHAWLVRQFDQRLVEPNSALGGAIRYLLKHWAKLTLFLRMAGAPLDNNICERALKRAILHRKNALFYKTFRGARVGDLFMSLIHTCELCGANPFDYLTELDRHAEELSSRPGDWMPWNYRETLAALTSPSAALS